jgi:AcrR family transcriptional regulator
MSSNPGIPGAVAETAGQRRRREAIIREAVSVLTRHGESSLQMKDLAVRAGVSVGTVYRYFPSKDFLLQAIALSRYEAVAAGDRPLKIVGRTVGERVEDLFIREFRANQRSPKLAAALLGVSMDTDRANSEMADAVRRVHRAIVDRAARDDQDELPDYVVPFLDLVMHVFASASCGWIMGLQSSEETVRQIAMAARLLDLPEHVLRGVGSPAILAEPTIPAVG